MPGAVVVAALAHEIATAALSTASDSAAEAAESESSFVSAVATAGSSVTASAAVVLVDSVPAVSADSAMGVGDGEGISTLITLSAHALLCCFYGDLGTKSKAIKASIDIIGRTALVPS